METCHSESTHITINRGKKSSGILKVQKCRFCPLQFGSPKEYLCHIEKNHQNNKNNNFMCSDCGKQYKTKNELMQHINSKCGTIKQYTCKICGQELMSAGSLYNHRLRHNGVRSFMCRFCAKLFFTAGQLKVHERIHTQDRAYVCEVCKKGFCHRQSLITHSTLHTGIKPYLCENCGNSFSCVGNLMKHRKTHSETCGLIPLTTHRVKHPSTKIKVKVNTPSGSRLKTQKMETEVEKEVEILKTELTKDQDEIKLPVITQNIETQQEDLENTDIEIKNEDLEIEDFLEIKDEVKNELEEYVENIKDNHSSEYSDNDNDKHEALSEQDTKELKSDESELNTYEDINVTSDTKRRRNSKWNYNTDIVNFLRDTNFETQGFGDCQYCSKRYRNGLWFYRHVKDHENNIPNSSDKTLIPLYKCCCCRSKFYTKDETLIHQQSAHADILTCQECEKMFANRDSLRSHEKVFHKGLGRKPYIYICEKCGKQFKQKSYLKIHEERNCDKGPLYECPTCNKEFSTMYTRNNHMRVHNSEKKLLCKFCAKSFHWKGQLKIHERSHTGEKPFACLYCPKAFAYRESLITHSSLHTGIKPHLCDGCGSRFSCIGNLIKHKSSHATECGAWTYKTQDKNK